MHITYHKEIERPEHITATIPHEILSDALKAALAERGVKQEKYYFRDNGFYFFLYLDNGDRLDYSLSRQIR